MRALAFALVVLGGAAAEARARLRAHTARPSNLDSRFLRDWMVLRDPPSRQGWFRMTRAAPNGRRATLALYNRRWTTRTVTRVRRIVQPVLDACLAL